MGSTPSPLLPFVFTPSFFHFAVDLLSTAMILDLLCRSSSDEALFSKMHAPFSLKPLNLCAGRPWGLVLWLLPSVGLTECQGSNEMRGGFPMHGCNGGVVAAQLVCQELLAALDLYLLNMLHLGYMLGVLCFKYFVHLRSLFSDQAWTPLYLVREHVPGTTVLVVAMTLLKKWSLSYPLHPHHPDWSPL